MPTPIRVLIQTCARDLDERTPSLIERSQAAREEAGCLQFEYFRPKEFPENLVRLELWESPAAFDAHWRRLLESGDRFTDGDPRHVEAPFHWGTPQSPRRHGQNGVEFYRFTCSVGLDGTFVPEDSADRVHSLRWAVRGAPRVILQGTADPDYTHPAAYFLETRAEPGCLQFEHYRSIEFPENTIALELWQSPEIYDRHYIHRNMQRLYGVGTLPPAGRSTPGRRYGRSGMEIYEHCYYSLVAGVWEPEDAAQRMTTIRLP